MILGASQLFSDKIDTRSNFSELSYALNGREELSFECFFEVEVMDGDVITPRLRRENIFLLS